MSLKLLTLNMEADRHLDRVRSVIAAHQPDILCLQEALETDCPELASINGYEVNYAVMARLEDQTSPNVQRNWGVALMSRVPVRHRAIHYYSADSNIRVLREPDDARQVLVVSELEHRGKPYRFITTHFTWSAEGQISDAQKADFIRLKQALSHYEDYVLCGDFNAPRGRDMFAKFRGELHLTDHLPASITTTIDSRFHRAGALELAVDTVFSTPEYQITNVNVLDGISDHKAIVALVGRST
ncbi:MAG: endonuclease/exonuclease/phosphatase family protein [Povalibacter sp.]